jgi:heme oxygenase
VFSRSSEPAEPSVIEALRDATRSRHESLASSAGMSRLFESDYTIAEYRAHLARVLGFFAPLEKTAAQASAEGSLSVVRRSTDLCEDLRAMGASAEDIAAIQRCHELTAFATGGLSGYAYVVLGSSLGAKIIVKQLRAVLGPSACFRLYGDEGDLYRAAWSAFLQGPASKRGKWCRADLRYSSGNLQCLRGVVFSAASRAGGH